MCFPDNNSHNIQLYQCLVSYQTYVTFLVDKMLNITCTTDKTNSSHVLDKHGKIMPRS